MRILACCGSGVSGSFIIQKNIERALIELDVKDVEVEISDLASAKNEKADIYVGGQEIAGHLLDGGRTVISINNIIDMIEIRSKLQQSLVELGYIK